MVFIDLPTGEVGFHVPSALVREAVNLPRCEIQDYDGHTKADALERMRRHARGERKG